MSPPSVQPVESEGTRVRRGPWVEAFFCSRELSRRHPFAGITDPGEQLIGPLSSGLLSQLSLPGCGPHAASPRRTPGRLADGVGRVCWPGRHTELHRAALATLTGAPGPQEVSEGSRQGRWGPQAGAGVEEGLWCWGGRQGGLAWGWSQDLGSGPLSQAGPSSLGLCLPDVGVDVMSPPQVFRYSSSW